MRETRRVIPKEWKCTNLNLWFSHKYNRNHPLLADDCFRVCSPLGLDWIAMFCLGAIATESFTKPVEGTDAFFTGNIGTVQEQLAKSVTVWQSVKSINDLPGISNKALAQFDVVYPIACAFLGRMADQDRPRPLPEPPPPPPPKPDPIVEPVKPKPEPKPDDNTSKPNPIKWKSIVALILGLMGAVGWAVKAFLPGWAGIAWDTVKAILEAITANVANLF